MAKLFEPFTLRGVAFRNRIGVSPMCMYAAEDGMAHDWHLVHLGSRAVGGAGMVMVEATGVEARGRITPGCTGLWSDAHAEPMARIAAFLKRHGAQPAIQLAHAGRKASTTLPWEGDRSLTPAEGAWETIAPSAIPFDPPGGAITHTPRAMTEADIATVTQAFVAAAVRSREAGFTVLELHAAHGYLFHEFLSPLANRRTDRWGGSFENRIRLLVDATKAVREVWPERLPLFVRLSTVDWKEGGWTLDESVALARVLKGEGVDLIDCSSGYVVPDEAIAYGPGFQVPFAERIRREAAIATAAVGQITEARQAEAIVAEGRADLVLLAAAMLHDAYWPLHAARELGALKQLTMPVHYDYVVRPRSALAAE